MFSSLFVVLGLLKALNLKCCLRGGTPDEVHGHEGVEEPVGVCVVHDDALDHESEGEGPVVLEVVVLVPEVHSLDLELESAQQVRDHLHGRLLEFLGLLLLRLLLGLLRLLLRLFLLLGLVLFSLLLPLVVDLLVHLHQVVQGIRVVVGGVYVVVKVLERGIR